MKPPIAVLLVCRLPSSTIEELIELGTLVAIYILINLLFCRILVLLTVLYILSLSVKPVLFYIGTLLDELYPSEGYDVDGGFKGNCY